VGPLERATSTATVGSPFQSAVPIRQLGRGRTHVADGQAVRHIERCDHRSEAGDVLVLYLALARRPGASRSGLGLNRKGGPAEAGKYEGSRLTDAAEPLVSY
jgi:hypothetical protein